MGVYLVIQFQITGGNGGTHRTTNLEFSPFTFLPGKIITILKHPAHIYMASASLSEHVSCLSPTGKFSRITLVMRRRKKGAGMMTVSAHHLSSTQSCILGYFNESSQYLHVINIILIWKMQKRKVKQVKKFYKFPLVTNNKPQVFTVSCFSKTWHTVGTQSTYLIIEQFREQLIFQCLSVACWYLS